MKFKTTRKAIVSMFPRLLGVGYCSMQYLLYYQSPVAYKCGVYGWNFDLYNGGGVGIATGYRNMPGVRVDYETLREYEARAEKIIHDYKTPYEERQAAVNFLLNDFINKALEA